MRKLYFLVPGTGGKFACGGLWAELKTLNLAQQICAAEAVTYRQREKDTLFLDTLLEQGRLESAIFVISWGFDVPKLAAKLREQNVIYHAHSAGYRFRLPARIPIITVSRNTLGYWGQLAPNSLLYYLPNQISDEFHNFHGNRDIDVLIQQRKSSSYLLEKLVPALQSRCRLSLIDSYIEDLATLFNRAKVYLYDSAEYWALQGVSEGFGLQPLEALACGCQVFSSINGGLSDYLDPGFNCYKIAGYSTEYDVERILQALQSPIPRTLDLPNLAEYRRENIIKRLADILREINEFFDCYHSYSPDILPLTPMRQFRLKSQRLWQKVQTRFVPNLP
jgi:glycosyltransferase involved in cell wall biosynthesis